MVKASIIIVSYNNLYTTTVPCLESILKKKSDTDFEIIVVDNNSNDGTQDYLNSIAARDQRVKPLLNKSNKGFAAANNEAIKASKGEYLILLNSDTVVPETWLEGLLSPLNDNSSIGIVGPVSNMSGNEQRIYTKGETVNDIISEGSLWTSMSKGDMFETKRLDFFCVAMKKNLITTVGLLDETFGLGFFEDDDYCIRTRMVGYKLICIEDVFIYHKGSASFSALPDITHDLLRKNKMLLEAKFGIRYSIAHPRDRQLDIIESYIERIETSRLTTALLYKINNRLQLVEGIKPRGPLKRLRFERRLHSLQDRLRPYLSL